MRVLTVRHGETAWSASGRHTGRTDIPLTEAGRHQAALAGARLVEATFALVLTSPLERARETCALAGLGDAAVVDDDLQEWDYGAYEGLTTDEIRRQRPGWYLWRDGCPGGEQAVDVGRRADRVIARCRAAGGDVAVFAHGHLLRVLGARWTGAGATFGASLLLSTAAVCVLDYERETAVLARWNDTGHLEPSLVLPPD